MKDTAAILGDLWNTVGLPLEPLATVTLTGHDPALPSSFRVGAAAQVSIAAVACAANAIWQARTGRLQQVSVDMRHAAAEFRSERYLRVEGQPPPELWDDLAGAYRCRDERWARIHTNFPHHRAGILALLRCAPNRAAVAYALAEWDAQAFEDAAAEAGMIAAMERTFDEWDAHPQGRAVATLPTLTLTLTRIGDALPESFSRDPDRPLAGVRVLDLTRVIAGPVCGRVLALHGAEVLNVSAAHLPSIEPAVIDTGRGKHSTFIDLRAQEGRQTLTRLLDDADIFLQSYRPGALAEWGFAPEEVAARRPGVIYVSLSAYGHVGPWAQRRGFDSIVQTATGLNHAEAEAAGVDQPLPLPCQALDHASGYLLALGAQVGLLRRASEGGSWLVQVSLAQTSQWLRTLGRVENGFACADPSLDDIADLLEESRSGWGRLRAVRHAAQMSETPPAAPLPSAPLGTHMSSWEM
jgi:crotonobetainyl-CoA:carnitine CoA-transferase CaiB-like acyl-CoA transferase